jgi:hypothetical protein
VKAWYDYGMLFTISALDVRVASASHEFKRVAESDIQSAHNGPTVRVMPSESAMAVYDELIRQEEAYADLMSEQFGA